MKRIKFTRHAKNRMRWHRITEKEVELALAKPQTIEKDRAGKVNIWRKVGRRYLRVTYKEESDIKVIITAVLKKKGPIGKQHEN